MAQIIQFPTPNPWAEQMKQEAIAVNEGLEALVAYRWNIVHELEQEPQSNEQLLVACRTLFSVSVKTVGDLPGKNASAKL